MIDCFVFFLRDRESEFVSLSHVAGASMNKKKSFKKIRRTLNKAKRELSTDSISADWYVDIDLRRIEHFDKVSKQMLWLHFYLRLCSHDNGTS